MFNRYTLRARVYPGLLALSPVLVSGVLLFPEAHAGLSALGSSLVAIGGLYLLSHFVRRAGKAREPGLWKGWGGKPTSVKLRWRTVQPADIRDLNRARVARVAPDVRPRAGAGRSHCGRSLVRSGSSGASGSDSRHKPVPTGICRERIVRLSSELLGNSAIRYRHVVVGHRGVDRALRAGRRCQSVEPRHLLDRVRCGHPVPCFLAVRRQPGDG